MEGMEKSYSCQPFRQKSLLFFLGTGSVTEKQQQLSAVETQECSRFRCVTFERSVGQWQSKQQSRPTGRACIASFCFFPEQNLRCDGWDLLHNRWKAWTTSPADKQPTHSWFVIVITCLSVFTKAEIFSSWPAEQIITSTILDIQWFSEKLII